MDKRNNRKDKSTATSRASARRRKRLRNRGRIGVMMIGIVVVLFGVVFMIQISDSKSRLEELKQQEQELVAQRDEQLKLEETLQEKKIYVQTKRYVEEIAKRIGLVYPDEIIFKPKE